MMIISISVLLVVTATLLYLKRRSQERTLEDVKTSKIQ